MNYHEIGKKGELIYHGKYLYCGHHPGECKGDAEVLPPMTSPAQEAPYLNAHCVSSVETLNF